MTTYYSTHTRIIKKLRLSNFSLKTVASTLIRNKKYFSNKIKPALKTTDIEITRKMIKDNSTNFNNFLPVSSKELPKGSVRDCVYFLFHDTSLMKIGKVGGGRRCVRDRAQDYRSGDNIAFKIQDALKESITKLIHMYYLDFDNEEHMEVFGIPIEPVYGPSLEKKLITTAHDIGYKLPWNEIKG